MTMQKVTKPLFAVLLLAVVLCTSGFAKRKCKHEKDTSKEVPKESEESEEEYDDDYTTTSTMTSTTTTTSPTTTSPTTTSTTTPNPCDRCIEPTECCFAGIQCRIQPFLGDDCGEDYCPCQEGTCIDAVCQL